MGEGNIPKIKRAPLWLQRDDARLLFGTGGDFMVLYETADTDARVPMFLVDESADSGNNIPAFVFSEHTNAFNANLGLFDGFVEASVVVLNNAGDAYASLDAGDDNEATAKGLAFRAAADEDIELINLTNTTGNPRIFWDESDDDFSFSHGIEVGGTLNANGNVIANGHQFMSVDSAYTIIRRDGAAGWVFDVKGSGNSQLPAMALTGGIDEPVVTWYSNGSDKHAHHVGMRFGKSGSSTGVWVMCGATSGTVTMTVAAAAGAWTMTLPAAVGSAGEQLTDAAGNGVTSWAAASSQREKKDILGEIDPSDALETVIGTTVYRFHYKEGMGTLDTDTEYVGVMADEAPWAMHYHSGIVNPVNTLGYMVGGFTALAERIAALEAV